MTSHPKRHDHIQEGVKKDGESLEKCNEAPVIRGYELYLELKREGYLKC